MSVFAYTNYRTFLIDCFQTKKAQQRSWNLRAWARHLQLASPSMLTMILKGYRNPGDDLTTALCRQLGLDPREESYFRDLIELQKVEGDNHKSVALMEKLAEQRPSGEFRQLSRETFQAISRWHYYAIREMVALPMFQEDAEWISNRLQFRVSPGEAKDAIKTLLKLGLLARDVDGKLRVSGGPTETTKNIADEGIKRFHEQALENARESLRKHPVPIRDFSGTTFATPLSKLPQAKALIKKFHQDFSQLLEDKDSDAIYHLEIGFYPVALGGNE